MFHFRSVVRALLPQRLRESIYFYRPYMRNLGVTKGLHAYYQLSHTKNGVVRLAIPQSAMKVTLAGQYLRPAGLQADVLCERQ